MNSESNPLDHQLLTLLHAARDQGQTGPARADLNELLRQNPAARAALARLLVDEQALIHCLREASIVSLLAPVAQPSFIKPMRAQRWFVQRPFKAAAAGLLFGMFCTSMVFGYVMQREAVRKMPLAVFDQGLESNAPLDKGIPHSPGQWGVQSARIVPSENSVQPLQGQSMLRMDQVLLNENDENLSSKAYQVLDLRPLPVDAVSGAMEAQVTASFCAPEGEVKANYLIRVVALNESPSTATENFWSKAEDAGVVSLTQRFETEAGDSGWHTFSVKMPLPHGAQSLIIILATTSPKEKTKSAAVRYLDDVQVSILTSPALQP
ncbi:MAG: hypothetical protein B7Z37_17870 [Verrucomicrobia bacterium 12-59-8]|nr:MAG: hypothetical protein B7Z37_17870 [Verrucomicrobia bacterium 12-59-8]